VLEPLHASCSSLIVMCAIAHRFLPCRTSHSALGL
jgi:hypothetical protein